MFIKDSLLIFKVFIMKTRGSFSKKVQTEILSIATVVIYIVIYLYVCRERFFAGVVDGLKDFLQ